MWSGQSKQENEGKGKGKKTERDGGDVDYPPLINHHVLMIVNLKFLPGRFIKP